MVKRPGHREWGSNPQSSRQVKKYGTIVGSSPTLSTSRFLVFSCELCFLMLRKISRDNRSLNVSWPLKERLVWFRTRLTLLQEEISQQKNGKMVKVNSNRRWRTCPSVFPVGQVEELVLRLVGNCRETTGSSPVLTTGHLFWFSPYEGWVLDVKSITQTVEIY